MGVGGQSATELWIYADDGISKDRVDALVKKTGAMVLECADENRLTLHLTEKGLFLEKDHLSMQGDLTRLLPRLRHNNLTHELLVKASRIRGLTGEWIAVDATAGMGEDSILLAASGYTVYLYEYDPVIAALLADALERAKGVPELADIVSRMHLTNGDSVEAMKHLSIQPDLILLDPMFPERQKSGLIKKKFQLLQQLEQPCANEEDLLAAAMAAAPKRIVIKRPLKGPYLAGKKPDYSLDGKAIRYDCIVLKSI